MYIRKYSREMLVGGSAELDRLAQSSAYYPLEIKTRPDRKNLPKLRALIKQLTPKQQEIIELYLKGQNYIQMADKLKISRQSATERLELAIKKLKKLASK